MKFRKFYKTFRFSLIPLSYIYGILFFLYRLVYKLNILSAATFDKKIISVGNISSGGVGKTPLVIFLSRFLLERNKKVVVVTLGYKRKDRGKIIDISDEEYAKRDTGDEAWLISRKAQVPVVVSNDKRAGCSYAIEKYNPDIILLDDGFQTFSIKRYLDIVLLDTTDTIENFSLLPAGKLRESPNALKRADIIILTRCNQAHKKDVARTYNIARKQNKDVPIFFAEHNPVNLLNWQARQFVEPFLLKHKRFLAISSIGNNNSFLLTLKELGLRVYYKITYIDHHRYKEKDIKRIKHIIIKEGLEAIITTEKDLYSLQKYVKQLNAPLFILSIELILQNQKGFEAFLKRKDLI